MRKLLALSAFCTLGACAVGPAPQEVEAVRDYVSAAELVPQNEMRNDRNSGGFTSLNEYFVIMESYRKYYLVEFTRRCIELGENMNPSVTGFRPDMIDVRRDSSVLRARLDTIRGCRIENFYEITKEQRQELKNLGDAPGEEVFLPDEKD